MLLHRIICGNALEVLRKLPSESVDMVLTSPPYYGLRDYGEDTETTWRRKSGQVSLDDISCSQLGLEPTPELYIDHLRLCFNEVKRVLKKTGSCWVNLGDTYGGSCYGEWVIKTGWNPERAPPQYFLRKKCLLMIPERFVMMMVEKLGFVLRNKIVWFKSNAMPTSAKDRFANRWEYVFFFVKSQKYFFDLDAVREPYRRVPFKRGLPESQRCGKYAKIKFTASNPLLGKNPGDVIISEYDDFWKVSTVPFTGNHYAVFPEELCKKPILAGCPQEVCVECKKPRERIINVMGKVQVGWEVYKKLRGRPTMKNVTETVSWTNCCSNTYAPGVVLDPFCGSGTVGVAAEKLRRSSIQIDIKKNYCEMAYMRLKQLTEQASLDGSRSMLVKEGF